MKYFGFAESEQELILFEIIKKRLFKSLRLCAAVASSRGTKSASRRESGLTLQRAQARSPTHCLAYSALNG